MKLAWKRVDKAFVPASCADWAKVEAPCRISTVGQSISGGGAPPPSATVVAGVPRMRLLNRSLKEDEEDEEDETAGDGFEPNRLLYDEQPASTTSPKAAATPPTPVRPQACIVPPVMVARLYQPNRGRPKAAVARGRRSIRRGRTRPHAASSFSRPNSR